MGRVRIGTCSGPADAALVRSVFDAHGVPIVINAELHASVLGGLGGAFVPLHIYVDDEHAEEAAALLEDLRARGAADPELDADDADGVDGADDADAAAGDEVPVDLAVARRRRTAIALLLGCCVTFGTAHMSTGAWFRGLTLAGLEVISIKYMAAGRMDLGAFLLVACVAADLVGGIWRARTTQPRIPVARVRR